MTTSQFFVYKRPIAWTLLVTTLAWGYFAYRAMPQRHDPIIPIRIATVVSIYPGADAEKVERELSQKVEQQVSLCENVEKVRSISRQNLSVVFVELFERVKNPEEVWQDLQGRLDAMKELPVVAGRPVRPQLNKDFGETAALMLTIASPKVSDFEIHKRAQCMREAISSFRKSRPASLQRDRLTAILVYPNTVARSYVISIGNSLLERLAERGLIEDGHVVEAPSAGCLDFQLVAGKSDEQLIRESLQWERDTIGTGMAHPDIWKGIIVRDLGTIETKLSQNHRDLAGRPDRYSYRELRKYADEIRDRLKQFPTIGKIDEIGQQDEAIYLYYSNHRLSGLALSPQSLAARLQRQNIKLPGGRLETPEQTLILQPSGEFKSEQELGDVIVDVQNGHPTCLRDLVEIVRGYEDPPDVMNYRSIKVSGDDPPERKMPGELSHGFLGNSNEEEPLPKNPRLQTTRAITLAVRQVKGTQIETFARDVEAALDSLRGTLPSDLQIERTHNEALEVQEKIRQFDQNLLEAIVIVVLVAIIFMEWRSALLVAVSIPVTIAMTLGICQIIGIDLQQVSIAAMIIALGLLVDDPVVAGDAINRELAHGVPRDIAAWLGPQKLARAILYATVTNCVAFLPLLLVKGKVGEFIYSLPVVVTVSLVSSRIVSMTFMPLLGYYVLRGQRGLEASSEGKGWSGVLALAYRRFAEWCLQHKALTLATCVLILCGGAALLPLLGTAFFPKDLHGVFSVNVFLAEGTPIRQTREETLKIVHAIESQEGDKIRAYTTFIGQGGPRFWLSIVPEQRADNYAQILVHTLHPRDTSAMVARLKRHLPPHVAAARVTIEQLETGPPVGVPIQVRLFGDDIEMLRRIAANTKQTLLELPGTDNIHDDWDEEVFQIPIQVKTAKANLAGISNEDVAMLLQTGLSGISLTQLSEQDRLIPITFRLRGDERARVEEITQLDAISSATNLRVPISQIVDLSLKLKSPKIWRRDHQRCITVKCDTVSGVLASEIVEQMKTRLAKMAEQWPSGYRFQFGGEYEEQAKGFESAALALLVSLAAIYLALVLQFNSVTKPLVVFAGVPFGMVGGMMGLFPFNTPFGFMAFLGVASLAGVIVSHVIVLFDYIEEACERGEPLRTAVVDSGLVRLRPVLVTVLATVGGLIPLAVEGGPLWEPMCYVQIAGLLLATVVTLGIVPVVYVVCVEDLKIIHWAPQPRLVLGDQGTADSQIDCGKPA